MTEPNINMMSADRLPSSLATNESKRKLLITKPIDTDPTNKYKDVLVSKGTLGKLSGCRPEVTMIVFLGPRHHHHLASRL